MQNESFMQRMQQISKLELRLRSLEDRARSEGEKNDNQQDIDCLLKEISLTTQHYDSIISAANTLKQQRL